MHIKQEMHDLLDNLRHHRDYYDMHLNHYRHYGGGEGQQKTLNGFAEVTSAAAEALANKCREYLAAYEKQRAAVAVQQLHNGEAPTT